MFDPATARQQRLVHHRTRRRARSSSAARQLSHGVLVTNLANWNSAHHPLPDGKSSRDDHRPLSVWKPIPADPRDRAYRRHPALSGNAWGDDPYPSVSHRHGGRRDAGVASCQLIQRGPANLTVRFTATSPREKPEVWDRLRRRLGAYLGEQGASDVTIEEASEQPQLHPTSGKFRQVYSDCPRWLGCERRHGRRTTARRQAGEFTVRIGAIRGYASPERRQVELVRDSSVLGRFG